MLTLDVSDGAKIGGLDTETCFLDPAGKVDCVWALPSIDEAVDKTDFELASKKYVSLSQSLSLFAAIDDTGFLRVRREFEDNSITYPGQKFIQVAATSDNWCMIKNDGTLMCDAYDLGDAPGGIQDVPEGEFAAVDVNERFACAIRVTGEVECWGEIAPSFEDKVRMD